MKFPFVSRAVYDDVRTQRDLAQTQVDRLTDVIIQMKVTGATIQSMSGVADLRLLKKREPSELEAAVYSNERCRRDSRLAAKMLDWGERQLAAGAAIEDVVARVKDWNRVGANDAEEASA